MNNIPDSPNALIAQQYLPVFERLFLGHPVSVELIPIELLMVLQCVIVGLKSDVISEIHHRRIKQIAQAWSYYLCTLEPELRPLIERIWRI